MDRVENSRLAELYEKYNDVIFEIALVKLQEQELKQFDTAPSIEEEQQADAFFSRTQERTLSIIHDHFRRKSMKHFMRTTLPRMGVACACALCVFFLSLTTAIATVPPVRARVLQLIMRIEEKYTTVSLYDISSAPIEIPSEWEGEYYPSQIPSGFAFKSVFDDGKSAFYENEASEFIQFTECYDDIVYAIDTEGGELVNITINGGFANLFKKNKRIIITWQTSDRFFALRSNIDLDDAIEIAESVRRIE